MVTRLILARSACDPMRSSEGGTAPNLGVLDQHLPDQRLSYVPFDPIREKEEVRIQLLISNVVPVNSVIYKAW
ncbi:hypothetical protein Y032_0152g2903 [Ancylostoma ceylanicum]|uniref:Uncharacterized protein n=1 Tax=Ancylostoma ceylanicum TaxID=53326 RepID=A0A016SZW3_9BILA|nr:hypothetical protein Y032_0152g2903 [Ancylostoma ceylanicum]